MNPGYSPLTAWFWGQSSRKARKQLQVMWASTLFTAPSAAGMTPKVFCSALLWPRGNHHQGQGPPQVPPPSQHEGVLQSAQQPGTSWDVQGHPTASGTQGQTMWRDLAGSRLEIWEESKGCGGSCCFCLLWTIKDGHGQGKSNPRKAAN